MTEAEMAANFSEYIDRVANCGERFILTRGNKPIAEIRPLQAGQKLSELFASLPHLSPEDAEAFGRDIDEAREEMNKIPIRDPWED